MRLSLKCLQVYEQAPRAAEQSQLVPQGGRALEAAGSTQQGQ
jgi:hypothetical protein